MVVVHVRLKRLWHVLVHDVFTIEIPSSCSIRPIQWHCVLCVYQAFHSVLALADARDKFREFCIPMTIIPSTISNNIPGTDFSLGADTALNEIADVRHSNSILFWVFMKDNPVQKQSLVRGLMCKWQTIWNFKVNISVATWPQENEKCNTCSHLADF